MASTCSTTFILVKEALAVALQHDLHAETLSLVGCLQQYYRGKGRWEYMPVAGFSKAFQQTHMAQRARGDLAQPYEAPNPECLEALIQHTYALNGKHARQATDTSAFATACPVQAFCYMANLT